MQDVVDFPASAVTFNVKTGQNQYRKLREHESFLDIATSLQQDFTSLLEIEIFACRWWSVASTLILWNIFVCRDPLVTSTVKMNHLVNLHTMLNFIHQKNHLVNLHTMLNWLIILACMYCRIGSTSWKVLFGGRYQAWVWIESSLWMKASF